MSMADVNQFYLDTPTANGIKMYIVNIGRPKSIQRHVGDEIQFVKPNTARESERILFKSTCDAMIEQADKHNQKAIGEQLKSPRVFNAIGVVYIVEVDSTRTNQHRHWQGIVYPYAGIIH